MQEFIRVYLVSIKRSPLFETQIVKKILSLIGFACVVLNLVFVGFLLDTVLLEVKPGIAPIDTFSRFFLYLFSIDIILKYFRKHNKYIDILPYLTVPIKLKKIFTLLFVKELFSKWNFIWVVILTPFFFKTFYPTHGCVITGLLILSLYLLCVTVSFFIRYINVAIVQQSAWFGLIPFLIATGLGCLAYYISMASGLSVNISLIFAQYDLFIFVALVLLTGTLYTLFLRNSKRELYAQLSGNNKHMVAFRMSWLEIFGLNGEIFRFCLKEMLRSQLKRTLFSAFLFLICSLMCLGTSPTFLGRVFWSVIPSTMLLGVLGEFTFGAESTLFDRLITSPQRLPYLLLINKYLIGVVFALFSTSIYVIFYINEVSLLFWISIFFFECGILSFFIFQNAVYNKKRFDVLGPLRKLSDSNIYSFLSMLFVVSFLGIVVLVAWLVSERAACYFMLITGIVFTFTSPLWLKNIYNRFLVRRYQIMEGFRNTL